jgi:hypothetical protein
MFQIYMISSYETRNLIGMGHYKFWLRLHCRVTSWNSSHSVRPSLSCAHYNSHLLHQAGLLCLCLRRGWFPNSWPDIASRWFTWHTRRLWVCSALSPSWHYVTVHNNFQGSKIQREYLAAVPLGLGNAATEAVVVPFRQHSHQIHSLYNSRTTTQRTSQSLSILSD